MLKSAWEKLSVNCELYTAGAGLDLVAGPYGHTVKAFGIIWNGEKIWALVKNIAESSLM